MLFRSRDYADNTYAGSLRYHLGLITPNDPGCYIEVDGQRYHWKDGEVVMFDETYIHHAANTTQHPRIILFADVERPVYTPVVRWINKVFAAIVMKASATMAVAAVAWQPGCWR